MIGTRHWGDAQAASGEDFVADALAGLEKLREEYPLLGGDSWRIVLLGSGSGALLARQVIQNLPNPWLPVGVITAGCPPTNEPWPDCSPTIAEALQKIGTIADPDDLLPPHLILHGAKDVEVPPTLARAWYGRLLDQDVPAQLAVLADAEHRFLRYPSSPAGARAGQNHQLDQRSS